MTTTLQASAEPLALDSEEIMRLLPHRYPFLLVDRVLELDVNRRIVGLKNVTASEPFMLGQAPGSATMPGLLIVEAMAQVGGILLMLSTADPASSVVYFMSLNGVRWRSAVHSGDQLRMEQVVTRSRGQVSKVRGHASVDGKCVCSAEMAAMVVRRP